MNDDSPKLMQRVWGRLLNKRMIPRYLFGLACLATLIRVFYAVEDWRGKRAWEKCRRELEAKGAVIDWNAYIPPPVPDEQNIFKAPKMTEWFVKSPSATLFPPAPTNASDAKAPFSLSPIRNAMRAPALLAVVRVAPPGKPLPTGKPDAIWHYEDPASHEQAAKLLDDLTGHRLDSAQGGEIIARTLDTNNPLALVLQADNKPTVVGLTAFLSNSHNYLQVGASGSNTFQVRLLDYSSSAADYLAASQSAVPALDLLREAVQRPYARMDGNYERPFENLILNFVSMRTVAQTLGNRAKCHLLLGDSEAAWHELALVREMCRMLEPKPASNYPTLVETMIDVAITGLYTSIVQDGLRLRVWREPELVAAQKQILDINLLPLVRDSFGAQRAGLCRLFETDVLAEFNKWLHFGANRPGLWERLKNPRILFGGFMPRGWFYQNMCAFAIRSQLAIESLDVPDDRVLPRNAENIDRQMNAAFSHFAPYTFMGKSIMPNFIKATSTTARNQTLVNEAYIACGLERYRLAHGQYPESLDALVPQFATKLPRDIISGEPLKYHRTADGRFVLYAVGWDGKDHGGVAGQAGKAGDWVWE